MKYFEVMVIGSGTRADPYRCALDGLGIAYSAHIPSWPAGHPQHGKPRHPRVVVEVDDSAPVSVGAQVRSMSANEALAMVEAREPGILRGRTSLRGRA